MRVIRLLKRCSYSLSFPPSRPPSSTYFRERPDGHLVFLLQRLNLLAYQIALHGAAARRVDDQSNGVGRVDPHALKGTF